MSRHYKHGMAEVHENVISCFSRKKIIMGNSIFLGHVLLFYLAWSKLSQATVTIGSLNCQVMVSFMIATGSLHCQDMIRIFKQSWHDFSGKHLCDGYCMDIAWWLCVEIKIQQSEIWFCKASLRICYVSLFECKDLWMLKTYIA